MVLCLCASAGWLNGAHWKCHYFIFRAYTLHEQWSFYLFQPRSQITLIKAWRWCASERASRGLIDCVPGQDEYLTKSVLSAPYGGLMSESVVKRGRGGGKENEGREERRTRRPSLFFLLLGFAASVIKLSHVKDRWSSLCVCACLLSAGRRDPPTFAHIYTIDRCLLSCPWWGRLWAPKTSAICSYSTLRVCRLISSTVPHSIYSRKNLDSDHFIILKSWEKGHLTLSFVAPRCCNLNRDTLVGLGNRTISIAIDTRWIEIENTSDGLFNKFTELREPECVTLQLM